MFVSRNRLSGKRKYLSVLFILLFISLMCMAFGMVGRDEFDIARREVLLRRIGHEVLLQSGDSISRVLPVKKIAADEYQISFESAFSFRPDSLVSTTQRLLAKDPLASDYVVNVLNCVNATVAYGYAISKNKKDDIVTCLGRKQPIACYKINIRFKPAGIATALNGYLLGALLMVGLLGFVFWKSVQPQKAPAASPDNNNSIRLGSTSFNPETRQLMINGETTDLTKTETRVLRIFALSPNLAIERTRLQKEIWEDEGVIVGRSLDMFISKLRKKLELDPNIKIVVLRGKGYKLEINQEE